MSNWSGSHTYRAHTIHRPTTVAELQRVVAASSRIRALGSRHSFNTIADSEELVSLEALEPRIHIDAETETVTVAAGVRYGELGAALQRSGWALRNLASLPHISVGGAIATGTHGSGDHNSTLSRSVSGLELVTADGRLHTISPAHSEFDGAVVALGLLGIVTRVTLDIEPSYDVRQEVYLGLAWESLLGNLDRIFARAASVSIFTGWLGDDVGQVWLKSIVPGPLPPRDLYGARPASQPQHPLPAGDPAAATVQGGVPGPWIDRLPHFRLTHTPSSGDELQSEYLVPRRHARSAIEAVRALAPRVSPHLQISALRTVAADSLWLSPASEEDVLGIHFTWKKDAEAVAALLPELEEHLAPFAARPHWGKLFHALPRELYPRLGDFVALAAEWDPTAKFRNDFLDRHVF